MATYSVGQLVSRSTPLVHVLSRNMKGYYCDACCTPKTNSYKRCTCGHMFYCSSRCQKLDWSKHRLECAIYLQHYDSFKQNTLDRLLLRLYLFLCHNPDEAFKVYECPNAIQTTLPGRSFNDLITNQEKIIADRRHIDHFGEIYTTLVNTNMQLNESVLFECFCKLCTNAYSIIDVNQLNVGSGLYLIESQFNHSCTPNAAVTFSGCTLSVRAIKTIHQTEAITVNYVNIGEYGRLRRKELRERYFFECACVRCNNDFDRAFYDKAERLKTRLCNNSNKNDPEKIRQAFKYGERLLELFDQLYGQYFPDKSVLYLFMLKMKRYLSSEADTDALDLIYRTGHHIRITHGEDSDLYKDYDNFVHGRH